MLSPPSIGFPDTVRTYVRREWSRNSSDKLGVMKSNGYYSDIQRNVVLR